MKDDDMRSFKAPQVWEVFQDETLRPYHWLILAGVECLPATLAGPTNGGSPAGLMPWTACRRSLLSR
jgi:hypothetical protein